MKAALCDRYGPPDVVRVADVPTPQPGTGEVLVRVRAATLTAADRAFRSGVPRYARLFFGLRRPRSPVLGSEFAGEVAAVGPGVTAFAAGDRVYGQSLSGAHAQYVIVPSDGALAPLPDGVDVTQAATLVDGTALVFLRDHAKLQPGQSIVVNGASGSVGCMAVQWARHFGADITAVCGSPAGADLVRSLGASRVVDYRTVDFTREPHRYDVVFDVAGASSFRRSRDRLHRGGSYLTTVPSAVIFVQMPWTARFGNRRAVIAFTGLRPAADKVADLRLVKELVEAGRLFPVVDSTYPLERIADAYRHLDAGGRAGTIVVTMPD
jgi:NADPH:quinone reductase-like Zn-dependent oxidoreductase